MSPERSRLVGLACVVALAVALPLGCDSASSPVAPAMEAGCGERFDLRVGQAVAACGLVVSFVGVLEDSRCPPTVLCFRGGSATVVVTVQRDDLPPASLPLRQWGEVDSSGRRIRFADLVPPTRVDRPLLQSEYVATFQVR